MSTTVSSVEHTPSQYEIRLEALRLATIQAPRAEATKTYGDILVRAKAYERFLTTGEPSR